MGDIGVNEVQHYQPSRNEWTTRYQGWFVPLKNSRTCGHKHETEQRALTCAQTLLNRARKDLR